MPTDEVSVPTMHVKPGTDVHRSLAGGMRGQIRREHADKRVPNSVPKRRGRHPERDRGQQFEDCSLGCDTTPRGDQAHRNLVAAVLERAIHDLHGNFRRENGQQAEALFQFGAGRWIKDSSLRAFGFDWCCVVLDLEPERVRAEIFKRCAA